ncbi:MAG: class I SAM-dependent methyltransferase [Methanoregula sp.]|nr:class I SAM-dependent methyltransferase [Methanoregula sp.]
MTDEAVSYTERSEGYDSEAEAVGWHGPAVVFGLAFPFTNPGETVLDIGIGTGLGSVQFHKAGLRVFGMDISSDMLEACRKKGFAARLVRHDLTAVPYPFDDASCDHTVSTGVFRFFANLDTVFAEVRWILADGGTFVFITGDRGPDEPAEVMVGPEHIGTNAPVTMYRHTPEQVTGWLINNGFRPIDSVGFSVWMDSRRSAKFPIRAYLAQKTGPE